MNISNWIRRLLGLDWASPEPKGITSETYSDNRTSFYDFRLKAPMVMRHQGYWKRAKRWHRSRGNIRRSR